MKVALLDGADAIGARAADIVEALLARQPTAVIGLATGSSPLPIYRELVARHHQGRIDFSRCSAVLLDEYVGLAADDPRRYRAVIVRDFLGQVNLPAASLHGPDPTGDLEAACAGYERLLADIGGVDVQILGIGANGHIGFNEPGASLGGTTHVGALNERTRRDNARFFDDDVDQVPTRCLTQGIGTIMRARRIVLAAQGEGKAVAVATMVEGAVSAQCPATALQFHPQVDVLLDEAAASGLTQVDEYRHAGARGQGSR